MDKTWLNGMELIKEILGIMNRGGKSRDEEEQIRRIMRDVISETSNASASERDMMHRMLQLMEQNTTKHSAELHATAQERDHYKAKLEDLNNRMQHMMRDGESHSAGGEGPELTAKQKRLAEMWAELKGMRQNERKPQYQSQNEGASSQFSQKNKGGTSFYPGKHPSQGRDTEKFEMVYHEDVKSGGFQRTPFQHDHKYQGPAPFSKKFPQHGETDRRRDYGPHLSNTYQSDDKYRQRSSGPEFSSRGAVQNANIQNRGPSRGFSQQRGQFHHRAQHQQPQDQGHPQRGQFRQYRGQSRGRGQGHSGPRNSPKEFSSNQFTPEEIEALKSVLKQREASVECTGKPGSVPLGGNPSKTDAKEKKQKKPKGAGAVLPESSDSDDEDAPKSSKEVSVKKKNKGRNKNSKNQAATLQKPEGLSPLEVFTASGFDMSQLSGLNMDDAVSDMMLITKEDGIIVSCQPETVRELVEFKQKYPNAQAIIVKTSDPK